MKRILHIASHRGNLGDMINHEGFYALLREVIGDFHVDKLELRDFYFSARHRCCFDLELAKHVNAYDFCVIGGGGYFDVRWTGSATGSTLDFSDDFLDAIHIPVLVNAMGYFEYLACETEETYLKFQRFLENVLSRPNWMITVRNDGSLDRIRKRYGTKIASGILEVPENGLFCPLQPGEAKDIGLSPVIGFCLATSLFTRECCGLDKERFHSIIAELIERLVDEQYHIVLMPHIPDDLETIVRVLSNVSDEAKRKHILVAPYDASTVLARDRMASYYRMCNCMVGMRFHSLVTALNLKIPTIALAGYPQIRDFFDNMNLHDFCVPVRILLNDIDQLHELISQLLAEKEKTVKLQEQTFLTLKARRSQYIKTISDFLCIHKGAR